MATTKSRIAADIRGQIARHALSPGQRLPSESALTQKYSASRPTIRDALGLLASEGLIESQAGRGWFVRNRAMLTYHAARAERPVGRSEADAYVGEVQEQGRTPTQDFEMRVAPAGVETATRLGIAEGDLVVCRRCLRYVDGLPWSDQHSYYPMDVATAAGLMTPDDIPEGTIRAMARAGYVEVGHVDEITGRMPTPAEAQTLDMGAGVPLLVYARTAWTSDRPVRVTHTLFPADRNRLVYELGADIPLAATA